MGRGRRAGGRGAGDGTRCGRARARACRSKTMNCTTCGTALVPGALFCPNCGSRVAAPSSVDAPTAGLPPTYAEQAPPLSQPYDPSPPPAIVPQWVAPGNAPNTVDGPPNSTAAIVSLVFGILTWIF